MKKPTNCRDCPAIEQIKGKIVCGCMRNLTAINREEELIMRKKCPLAWK